MARLCVGRVGDDRGDRNYVAEFESEALVMCVWEVIAIGEYYTSCGGTVSGAITDTCPHCGDSVQILDED
jgi:hypothetical protein